MEMFKQPFRSEQEPEPDQTAPKRVIKADIDDLLYEGKNKAYGGHPLRKEEGIRTFNSLMVVAGIAALCVVLINWNAIMDYFFAEKTTEVMTAEITATPEEIALTEDQLIPVTFSLQQNDVLPIASPAEELEGRRVQMTLEIAVQSVDGGLPGAAQSEVNAWQLEQNLNGNSDFLQNLQFSKSVLHSGGFGTTDLIVTMNKYGRLSPARFANTDISDFDRAIAKQIRGLRLPPLKVGEEIRSAHLMLSFHHRLFREDS